ncbi:uncharacterized protein BDZ83DRAFT_654840 [Colletotrichum acutatum]|uniref:Uncharacterized protein n=1 Tax=Glomerella acutata TaxID=27357 RepID=A0AAD8UCE8_GLOAC|nr:uncharacterized protein BDZ83DRAFT_654840 [Colletotrichum acutatum]KAK1719342.1 hypothetical protein BDZ83DRAFT_654840 [Colletotrichum acutatum]
MFKAGREAQGMTPPKSYGSALAVCLCGCHPDAERRCLSRGWQVLTQAYDFLSTITVLSRNAICSVKPKLKQSSSMPIDSSVSPDEKHNNYTQGFASASYCPRLEPQNLATRG